MARDFADSPMPPGVVRGIGQFNAREFFECHESIEEEWRRERGEIRALWQGILQIGVAMHHIERGKWWAAMAMLERGLLKLRPFAPVCQGVDVARLAAEAARCGEELRHLGEDRIGAFDRRLFPVIRRAGESPETERAGP